MKYQIYWIVLLAMLTGCQSLAGDDTVVTVAAEMTAFATESVVIQQTSVIEQTAVVETVQAAGTTVAEASNANMVLAETVRANVIPTQPVREVIVNPEDMGSSLDTEMMEDESMSDSGGDIQLVGDMQINNLGTARNVRSNDGCSSGNVTQFTDNDERIYFTAQVTNLANGTNFSVDWVFEERLVYRSVWTSDYSVSSECIWFYMTPDDAPFLPGTYTVTLYVNGNPQPSQQFAISIG